MNWLSLIYKPDYLSTSEKVTTLNTLKMTIHSLLNEQNKQSITLNQIAN